MSSTNAKLLKKQLQRQRIRPTKAAFRHIKANPSTWRAQLYLHPSPNGILMVFTQREAAFLRRKVVNKQITEQRDAAKSARQKELIVATVFASLMGAPALILIAATSVALFLNLIGV